MTTSVEVPTDQLTEIQAATQQPDPSAAVRIAMREYLNYFRRMQLKQLSGQVEMQENWRELEDAELNEHDG